MTGTDVQNHVRPTEAQLRWARFNFKSRASRVKVALESFYLHPGEVQQVDGAYSDDGNTTTEEESTGEQTQSSPQSQQQEQEQQHRPRGSRTKKPRISRGRRALLRVSQRQYQKRREGIENRGFGGGSGNGGLGGSQEQHDSGDVLESLFADEAFQRRRRRKRRRNFRSAKEADQVRRFEAAFHSMMKNLEASQKPRHVIETPTKIWTRPEGAEPREGIDYSAIKLMGSQYKRRGQHHHPYNARWSFFHNYQVERTDGSHLQESTSRQEFYSQGISSPVRNRFKEIVTEYQQRIRSPVSHHEDLVMNALSTKLTKYFLPAELRDDEESSAPPEQDTPIAGTMTRDQASRLRRQYTEEQLDIVMHSIDPQLWKEMEQLDPGVTDRMRALYLGEDSPQVSVKTLTKLMESPSETDKGHDHFGFVHRFVAFIEQEIQNRKEDYVAADGKLHKASFARLVNQYLSEVGGPGNSLQPSTGTNTLRPVSRSDKVSSLAQVIAEKLSRSYDCDNGSRFVDSHGSFDRKAFGDLVTQYLSEATGFDERAVREVDDLESLTSLTLDQQNNYIQSMSHQCAIDFGREIETIIQRSSALSDDQIFSEAEEMTRLFLVLHCSVLPQRFDKEHSEEPALFRTIATLRDATLSAFHHSHEGIFDRSDCQARLRAHFVRLFEASHASVKSENDDALADVRARRNVLINELISCIQHAATVEQISTPEGTLDIPTITKLLQRYLAAASRQNDDSFLRQAQSPLVLAQMRRMAGSRRGRVGDAIKEQLPTEPIGEEASARFVSRCIQDLKITARCEVIVSNDGSIDESKVGQILRRSFNPDYFSPYGTDHTTNIFDFPDREPSQESLTTRSVVSELTHGSIPKSQIESASTIDDHQPKQFGGTMMSVSKSIGGLVRRLYNSNEGSETDEVKAYAAFRFIRNPKSDDISSQATFNLEGVNSRAKQSGARLKQGREDDATGETGTPIVEVDSCLVPSNGNLLSRLLDKTTGRLVIDTDADSDVGTSHQDRMKHLLLSPAIISKRHRQAIRCIENRQWKEVQYLINANPWLAEMSDANSKQYLLHKLALYGAGEIVRREGGTFETHAAAPSEVNVCMVRLFPSSVHKFDQEGNLPLHMAAASANLSMVKLLGDRFPSGATVRNEDGLLPLHLALLACASPRTAGFGDPATVRELLQTIVGYFPGAVAVLDNDGNLPIHTAASVLKGQAGVEAIFMLFDEAQRQLQDPWGVRFRNKAKIEELENMSIDTEATETPTDSSSNLDDVLHCTMVQNDDGETPLLCAIRSQARWEVIDALVQGPCGKQSALVVDDNGNNALHLLLHLRYQDPTSALSVLKVAPETARVRNTDGILPIELACMYSLPIEVIMAIVLVDLPIDLDNKDDPELRPGFGHSWWFIACDCDDHYTQVVDEIVGMCSVAQVRELAFMENSAGESLISRAAPESMEILHCSLRFLGRFEIKSEMIVSVPEGVTIFEALDFGYPDEVLADGIDVFLKFFTDRSLYEAETTAVRELQLDFSLVEEVFAFDISDFGDEVFDETKQFCLCIERPQLTLAEVVSGMLRNDNCQNDSKTRMRYTLKALAVLRLVANGLAHLHSLGVAHGNISVNNIGKYENGWKVAGISGVQRIGGEFDASRFSFAVPPEALSPEKKLGPTVHEASFRDDLIVSWSIDSWGFGKLAYEVLVAKPLVPFDNTKDAKQNHKALMDIMHWNDFNVDGLRGDLLNIGAPVSVVDLIEACLSPEPSCRPSAASIVERICRFSC